MDADKMRQQLMDRLSENYGNYQAALLLYDRQELIARASEIADTANAYQYLTQRSYTEQELACLLQFQNPLEVVADHLQADTPDFHVLDAVIADMPEKQAELSPYPLMKDAPAPKPETMRKFMNVDIESTLKQLRGQMTIYYQDDLNYALDKMRQGARSDRPEKKNFVVFFRKSGSTNENSFPPPTGTSKPKPRNGGRHGRNSATGRWSSTDTQSASTTAVMNGKG